jgi:lysophospholipase L1-like esterase
VTISSASRKAGPFLGNGVTTSFPFTFKVFQQTDLQVIKTTAAGIDSVLILNSDYSVALNADQNASPGGTITYPLSGPLLQTGEKLTTTGVLQSLQETHLTNGGNFFANTIEDQMDYLTILAQQHDEKLARAVLASSSDLAPVLALGTAGQRALKYVTFDSQGNLSLAATLPAATLSQASIVSFLGADPLQRQTASEIAASVTPTNLTYRVDFIERQGAVADYPTTDNLTSVNKAILANAKTFRSYDGNFKVSAAPTNPYGIEFQGPGALLLPTAFQYPKQLNTYADLHKYMIGREYLYRVDLRLSVSSLGLTNIGCFLYGDSTIAGGAVTAPYLLQTLLPLWAKHAGLTCGFNVTNRGVSGTSISDMNAIPDLSTSTDLYIIKYGINDGSNPASTRLATFATTLRSKLAAIRAATNGDLPHLAILLVGPNSTADDVNGRNEQWYEQLRGIYVQAARDYNCAYFDTYAYLKDSRPAANLWMDSNTVGGQLNVPIHPTNLMQVWIWGAVFDFIFPRTAMDPYRGNHLQNIPTLVSNSLFNDPPDNYDFGITLSRALTTNGWPVDGSLMTVKHVNGPSWQVLYPTAPGTQIYERQGNTTTWGIWYGEDTVTPALANSWVAFAAGSDAKAVKGGKIVCLSGVIKNGTTTNGTTLFTLPAGFRPRATYYFTCATSAGTAIISVDTGGAVVGQSGLNATYTSVSGINFEAFQ